MEVPSSKFETKMAFVLLKYIHFGHFYKFMITLRSELCIHYFPSEIFEFSYSLSRGIIWELAHSTYSINSVYRYEK